MKLENKYMDAVRKYEEARQLVAKLSKERYNLIAECSKVDHFEFHSKVCLVQAYDDTNQIRKENNEYYSYREILEDGFDSGKYCKSCHDSHAIKRGPLAEAKALFGNAKRKLSALGKGLIIPEKSEKLPF